MKYFSITAMTIAMTIASMLSRQGLRVAAGLSRRAVTGRVSLSGRKETASLSSRRAPRRYAMKKSFLVLALAAAGCHAPQTSKASADVAIEKDAEARATIEVVPLKYASADQIAMELRSVLEGLKSRRSMRVVADSRTNSIIVTGPREDLAQVLALIEKLDVKQP